MTDLAGRIALVTGASRGLGAATARALAAAGAKVAVTDLVAPEDLAAEIGGIARAQDVCLEADWAATMDWIRAEAGGLDILVNNAGCGCSSRSPKPRWMIGGGCTRSTSKACSLAPARRSRCWPSARTSGAAARRS